MRSVMQTTTTTCSSKRWRWSLLITSLITANAFAAPIRCAFRPRSFFPPSIGRIAVTTPVIICVGITPRQAMERLLPLVPVQGEKGR